MSDFAEEVYRNDLARKGRIKYILDLASEVVEDYPKEKARRGIEDKADYCTIEEAVEAACYASGLELTQKEIEEVYRLWYN